MDPSTRDPQEPFRRARAADDLGLDLITIQDHPYNRQFFDTWTLLAALATSTRRIHLGTNVISTPLRPPAMLSKMAATLDVLSGGRVELGLGAGAYAPGIAAYGGAAHSGPDAFAAFEDALLIIRGMWEAARANRSFTHAGRIYQVRGARPGPAPAHPIRIWTGAAGPRMMRLTGRLADGIFLSSTYVAPEKLLENNRLIDEGAAQAGRSPADVRRGYNLLGVIDLGRPDTRLAEPRPGQIYGTVQHWVDAIARFYRDYQQDTFICWPIGGNELLQLETFAREVVPAARAAIEAIHSQASVTASGEVGPGSPPGGLDRFG